MSQQIFIVLVSISFNIFRKVFFVILILILSGLGSFAQDKSEGEQKVEDEAFMFFTNKDYDKAMSLFSQLLSLHPQDPSYNYGYGVCLIETNTDTKGALKYLKFSQSKSQNPVVYYYIGRSYHLNYQFDKAISNYQLFKEKAPKSDLKEFAVDQKIRMAENGKELINYVSDLIVLDNKKIKDENFYYSYRLDDFGGKLIVTPKDFKTKVDIKKKYRGITFIWNDSVAFFASYGGNRKGSLDIYEVKKNPDNTWSPAQNIGSDINTPYDENFPYLSPDGKTFYFSSKGFNSMGGYDIFKSVFDSTTARFSKPENMDFPINSPFDDLLYVTDSMNQFAYFASKRETGNDEISVYRIQVDKNRHKRPIENIDEIIEKAKLNVTPLANRPSVNEMETTDVGTQEVAQNKANGDLIFPELKPKTSDPNAEVKQAVKDDLQRITENVEKTKDMRDVALVEAYDKTQQADELREKANKILKGLDQVPDDQEQTFLKKEAQGMLNDATRLSQEAVAAYNLNKHLNETVKYKEQDVTTAKDFIEKTTSDENADSLVQAYNKIRKQFNQNQNKYITVEKEVEQRNQLMASNLGEIKKNQSKLEDLNSEIKLLNDDLTATENRLSNASSQDRPALQEKHQQQVKALNKLISKKNSLVSKTNYLIAQNDGLKDEIKYLRSFNSKAENTEIGEVHQKMAEIDKTTLSKSISETENNLEMDLAQQVAEKNEAETESLLAEDSVPSQNDDNYQTNNHESVAENNKAETEPLSTKNSISSQNDNNSQINNNESVAENNTENTNTKTDNLQTNTKSANEQMADSLQTIIAQKKEQINQTTDAKEKQTLQNEVRDLSQILNTIRPPQENKNIAQNKVLENKEETLESRFPDMKIKQEDDASTKYEKTLFKEQYLTQAVKEQKTNLENLKTIRKTVDNPESAQSLDKQIAELSQKIDENQTRLTETQKQVAALKQEVEKTQQVKQLTDAELILRASKYTPKNSVEVITNPADKKELTDLKKQTNDLYYNYLQLGKEVDDLQKRLAKKEDKDIEKQLKELKQQKENTFNDYLANANRLNTLNYYYYDDKIYDSQVISDDPKSQKANQMTNEAEYYFNLSKSVQESAKTIEDEDLKEKELAKSLTFQQIAIEKQKHALDLYVSLNNTAGKTPTKTNENLVQLSPDDINTLKTADKIYYKSTVQEKEAKRLNEEAATLRKQAENTFEEKKKASLLAKAEDEETEATEKHTQSLQNNITADSLKFSVNTRFIDSLFVKNKNKDVHIANLYVKEANTYNEAAKHLRARILQEKDPDTLLAMNEQIQKFYEKSVSNQQNAIAALTQEQRTNFIAVSPVTEINQLTTINKKVETRNVPDVDEKKLFNNLSFNEEDQKTLDLANKVENKPIKKMNQAKDIDKQILDLENAISTSDNPKRVNADKKKLEKLQSKRDLLLATAYDDYGPINYTRFNLLKSQLIKAKKGGDNTHRHEAIQLVVNAQKDFQKAARIRDASLTVKDRKTVYKDLEKAYNLEKKAITQIEKSIALYKGMMPEFNKQPLLANTDTAINTNDFAIKNTGNITPVEVSTVEQDTTKNLIAENTTKSTIANTTNDITSNNTDLYNKTYSDTAHSTQVIENLIPTDTTNLISENTTMADVTNNTVAISDTNTSNISNVSDISDTSNTSDISNTSNTPDISKVSNVIENSEQLPIDKNDITLSFPSQMKSGETYSVTATIKNDKKIPMKEFARFQMVLPKGITAENMSSKGAQATFDEQTVKFLWMNLPEGEFSIQWQIVANNTNYLADSVHAIFEYASDNGIQKIDIPEYLEVQPPEVLAQNRNSSTATNVQDNTNNLAENTNQNTATVNTANNAVNNTENNDTQWHNKTTTQTTVKTVSNNDVPYSYMNFDAYTKGNPIPVNPSLPAGIIFKVQLGAFSNPIPDNTFKGLNPIVAEKSESSRFYKYLLGEFQTFEGAKAGRAEVRSMGYRDAFIVAYKDGKRIPIYQARNFISQSGNENYPALAQEEINKIKNRANNTNTNTVTAQTRSEETTVNTTTTQPQETVANTTTTIQPQETTATQSSYSSISEKQDLIYTVQIGVFKRVPESSFFRGLSPVYEEKTPYGFIRYFIGSFNSKTKATAEKDKIVQLGIHDAFVVPYYNGKRISLPEAQKLAGEGKSSTSNENVSYPETPVPQPKSTGNYAKEDVWFAVQVGAFQNAVPIEKVQSLMAVSRNNEINQIKDKKGFTLFIIGNFKSYDKAKELAAILKNDGVTDAFVAAFAKQQKIPVADAIAIMNGQ